MAIDPIPTTPRSRRALLAGAVGGLATLVAGRFASPERADAAAGAALVIGSTTNNAGTSNTTLTTASTGTALLITQNGTGTALRGSAVGAGSIAGFFTANNGTGISGVTGAPGSYGVFGQNNGAAGSAGAIRANGGQNHGLVASTANLAKYAVHATGANGYAIYATALQTAVEGHAYRAVVGITDQLGQSAGVFGDNTGSLDTYGVYGRASGTNNARGVFGEATGASGTTYGVYGSAIGGGSSAVYGNGITGAVGVQGVGNAGGGVLGTSSNAWGVHGVSTIGSGVLAESGYIGVYGVGTSYAGYFVGDLATTGTLTKAAGTFKIDHPLDPANMYLYHSFVESPDAKNVYDGLVTLDANGEATVKLPRYFEALNRDARYQLTAIGAATPGLHIKSEVKGNVFAIAGGAPGQKVSWQVTGIRRDAYAKAHPMVVEAPKTGAEKGRYLHPVEHGQPTAKGIVVSPKGKPA